MHQNIHAKKWIDILLMLICACLLVYFSYGTKVAPSSDDGFYLSIFRSGGWLAFCIKQYHEWSGRSAIDLLMISTIGYTYFWKVGIPVSILITCICCCRISGLKSSIFYVSICCFVFFLMPKSITNDSSYWVTGFYNYLLPTAAALYVLSVVFSVSNNNYEKIICIFLCFYFPYMEQAGLCFLVAMSIFVFINRENSVRFELILISVALLNFIVCISAPGSSNRSYLEAWNWYPQYHYYSLGLKIMLGIDKLDELIRLKWNIPYYLSLSLLILFRSKKGCLDKISMFCVSVVSSQVVFLIFYSLTDDVEAISWLHVMEISGGEFYNPIKYISYFFMLLSLSSCAYMLMELSRDDNSFLLPLSSLVIGSMSVVVMGFSPTVFASGFRVYHIFEICCMIMIMFFLKKILLK